MSGTKTPVAWIDIQEILNSSLEDCKKCSMKSNSKIARKCVSACEEFEDFKE